MKLAPTVTATPTGNAKRRGGAFTLVEMLVVLGIIVLVVLMAVPAFRAMSGGRSLEAAANNLSAILGAARTQAIASQRNAGVLFLKDPATGRMQAVLVQDSDPPRVNPAATPPPSYQPVPGAAYLDVTDPVQSIMLPVGVGLQVMDDNRDPLPPGSSRDTPTEPNDHYLGLNPIHAKGNGGVVAIYPTPLNVYSEADGTHTETGVTAQAVGVVMFDYQGRVIVRPFRLKLNTGSEVTNLHRFLRYDRDFDASGAGTNLWEARIGPGSTHIRSECRSSVGLALFDWDTFRESPMVPNQSVRRVYDDDDPQYTGGAAGTGYNIDEKTEEDWLDQNALIFYVNRYNGSLVRGE